MELKPVESSNVSAIGYDASAKQFDVRFKNGATYRYHDVGPESAAAVTDAESIGRAVNSVLKQGGFKAERLPEEKK